MKKLLLFSFLIFSYFLNAQTLKYEVTSGSNHLGEIKVTHTENKENKTFHVNIISNVSFDMFKKITLAYELNVEYKKGKLFYSSVTTYIDGKIHTTTTTEKTGEYYTITQNNQTQFFKSDITYSGALLYFKEPVNVLKNYSEFDGFEKQIIKLAAHQYQVINPKNKQLNEYYYKGGVLQYAIIHHTLITFKMRLK